MPRASDMPGNAIGTCRGGQRGRCSRARNRSMDLSKLAPSDAVVALRSLERRYRGLFAGLGDDESPDNVGQRLASNGWSALEHIVAAAWAISAAGRALKAVLTLDKPVIDP